MLPHPFSYHRPESLDEAFELFDRYDDEATFYAGGTELLLALKARVLRYGHLIDLKRIPGLSGVREERGHVVIGALSSHHRLSTDPVVRQYLPAYAALSDNVANIRVRVSGTIGGNLCFAEPHADPPALLAAMGASVVLQSGEECRQVAVGEFIESEFTTARADREIMTEIRVPRPPADAKFVFKSFGHLERPAVSVAAGYCPSERGARFRLWVGAIAERPLRLVEVEQALDEAGPAELEGVLETAAARAAEELPALSDLHGGADYKRALAQTFICRAVRELIMRECHD
jgi:carbon-monoxide dehydrogenase medium subunit